MNNVATYVKNGFMALTINHNPNKRAPTIKRSFLIYYILSIICSHTKPQRDGKMEKTKTATKSRQIRKKIKPADAVKRTNRRAGTKSRRGM
jgi:hypothetical protein